MKLFSKLISKVKPPKPEPKHKKLSPEEREAEMERLLYDPVLRKNAGLDN